MELRRLRLLHELSRHGTVASVAQALSYSPSSVSVQLSELERQAGAKLLRRVGRNVELTPAGQRLAAHAAEALAADEAVCAELAGLSDAPRGAVRMTFVQSTALALLPRALSRLADTAPDLRVEVVQRETAPALGASPRASTIPGPPATPDGAGRGGPQRVQPPGRLRARRPPPQRRRPRARRLGRLGARRGVASGASGGG